MEKRMKKRIINLLAVICLLIALNCGGYLVYYYYTSAKSESAISDLSGMIQITDPIQQDRNTESESDMIDVDGVMIQKKFEKLYKQNHDFIGWITIADTHVDYPVMYTPDDNERGEFL